MQTSKDSWERILQITVFKKYLEKEKTTEINIKKITRAEICSMRYKPSFYLLWPLDNIISMIHHEKSRTWYCLSMYPRHIMIKVGLLGSTISMTHIMRKAGFADSIISITIMGKSRTFYYLYVYPWHHDKSTTFLLFLYLYK